MDEEYQQKMVKLQKKRDNEAQKYDELVEENRKMSAELHQYQTCYYSMKMDTDSELVQMIDEELQISNQISKRHSYHSDGFRKDFNNMVHEMDVVLGTYDTEKKAERTLAIQAFQKFKEIPKNFSNEVMLEKTKLVDNDVARVTAEIAEITGKMDETREAYISESMQELHSNLSTVVADVKTTNVKLNLFLKMKK